MRISKYQWGSPIEEWGSQWKDRLQPSARSKVLQKWNASGKKPKPESSNEYTKRRVKEETKRTWRSDAADIAHGIGEGVLALHPYTAIPYYGAKVGQDVINGNVNWNTALNASIPLFHLSPQAVGLKEATNVALEDAANAGSKTARNWRVAREINEGIKQNTKNGYIEVPYSYFEDPNSAYRATTTREVRDLGEVGHTRLASESKLADADYTQGMQGWLKGTNYMKEVENSDNPFTKAKHGNLLTKDGVILETRGTGRQFRKGYHGHSGELQRFEDIDVSVPELTYDRLFGWGYRHDNGFSLSPFTFKGIGLKTGDPTIPAQEISWFTRSETPGRWTYNGEVIPEKRIIYEPTKPKDFSTSLKFFERKPSRISEAESLGFGKSRGFNPKFGDDIHQYYILKDRRQTIQDAIKKLKAPKDMGVDETISKNSGAIMNDGYLMSNGYHYTPVSEKHFSTGYNMSFGRQGAGGSGHNYGLNLGGQSTRVKDLDRTSEIAYNRPGANLDRNDPLNLEIVVTTSDNAANKKGIQLLTKGMKDMESGAEFSGDASSTTAAEALSTWIRIAKNKPALREIAMTNARKVLKNNEGIDLGTHSIDDPLHKIYTENATMSPDAYSYIYRTAENNPDKFHLGYQMNAGNFNSFARNPKNAYMYDVEQNYLDGLITPQEYVKQFNSWSVPLGGRRAYFYNGRVYKPQPFLIRNKQGGKMNTLQFLKNGSGIHIKKKNRGKFTDYCGGKVTDSCIRRAKASGNPTLVKRATFAGNVRKWKH